MNKTQLTPATPKEIERFKEETGITDLENDPPGSETLTVGQYLDEVLERRRLSQLPDRGSNRVEPKRSG